MSEFSQLKEIEVNAVVFDDSGKLKQIEHQDLLFVVGDENYFYCKDICKICHYGKEDQYEFCEFC